MQRLDPAQAEMLRDHRIASLGLSVSNVAHDLNNVLAPILTGLEVLRATGLDAGTTRLIEGIERHANYGADLVRQLLAFARGTDDHPVAVNLGDLIASFAPVLRTALSPEIPLAISCAPDAPAVTAHPIQLKQVLMNLCLNARDAMPKGGQLEISVQRFERAASESRHPEAMPPGCYAALLVRDTGVGIPARQLERIFDPFYTTKAPGQGTGLGLALVQSIVSSHGGFLTVESEVGKGTLFRILLPRTGAERAPHVLFPDAGRSVALTA
jgi:signal transduction histidine kinase